MVEGIPGFTKKFNTIVPLTIYAEVGKAMERAAKNIVADMKKNVPVYAGPEITRSDGSPIIKGALRDSIAWTWGNAPKGAIIIAKSNQVRKGKSLMKITIYAGGKGPGGDAFYARWVEFGTKQWAGSPFFFFTYRGHKRRAKAGVSRALNKAIKQVNGL